MSARRLGAASTRAPDVEPHEWRRRLTYMRRISMLAILVLALAACARANVASPGAPQTGSPDAFEQRARDVVAAWERAGMSKTWRLGFVPLSQDRVIIAGDPGFTEESKQALLAGRFTVHAGLPLPPPPGQVAFPDGTRMPVRLMTAEAALADMRKPDGNACDHPCQPLEISRITLGTATVLTTRGNATVPAWQFKVTGVKTPIAYVAVEDRDISDIPAAPEADYPALDGLVGADYVIQVSGATITYTIGVGSCDKDIKPLFYETADTIALGGSVTRPDGVCNMMLKEQPVTVTLAKPVGDRALINGLDGQPLTASPFR